MITTFMAAFSFGYCVTHLAMTVFSNNKAGKYDEPR